MTLADLHVLFPPSESVHRYSYAELLRLYHETIESRLIVPASTDLIAEYKTYLRGKKGLKQGRDKHLGGGEAYAAPVSVCPGLDLDLPSQEIYDDDDYQHLKGLHTHPHIYGMQNVPDACTDLYSMMRFLIESVRVKRLACLECSPREEEVWHALRESLQDQNIHFYNRQIQDYTSYTFDNAMFILSLIHGSTAPIVFHCTAGFGRTGSVMYLILLYFHARRNRNVLRKPLLDKEYLTHEQVNATNLAKEYSFQSAEEFFDADNVAHLQLRTCRLNIANQAVAHTLDLYEPTLTQTGYIQYTDPDFVDLDRQELRFTNYTLKDKSDVIRLEVAAEAADGGAPTSPKKRRARNECDSQPRKACGPHEKCTWTCGDYEKCSWVDGNKRKYCRSRQRSSGRTPRPPRLSKKTRYHPAA